MNDLIKDERFFMGISLKGGNLLRSSREAR
jgi:hypothetical protein